MSIVRTFSVFCDGLDGDAPCGQWEAQTTEGVREARQRAKEAGWVRVGAEDFCPSHNPSKVASEAQRCGECFGTGNAADKDYGRSCRPCGGTGKVARSPE